MDELVVVHLILGPTLVLLSIIYKRFPPKKINHFYGYRTPRSMKSQEAWDTSNAFSANCLVIVSLLTCLMQVVFYSLIEGTASIGWSAGFLVVALLASIPITEMYLKKKGF